MYYHSYKPIGYSGKTKAHAPQTFPLLSSVPYSNKYSQSLQQSYIESLDYVKIEKIYALFSKFLSSYK